MKATYRRNHGDYLIVLNRKEAELLGNASTKYNLLLTALELWKDCDEFHIFGSKFDVEYDLEIAQNLPKS